MKKILLVEDDSTLALRIDYSLKMEGYSVDLASTVNKAKKLLNEIDYELIILDIMMEF